MSSSDQSSSSDSEIDELARFVFEKSVNSRSCEKRDKQSLDDRGNSGKSLAEMQESDTESAKTESRHTGDCELFVIDRSDTPASPVLNDLSDRDSSNETLQSNTVDGESSQKKKSKRSKETKEKKKKVIESRGNLSSRIECSLSIEDGYIQNIAKSRGRNDGGKSDLIPKIQQFKMRDEEIMKKSIISPDFEKNFAIPPYEESLRQQKKQRKAEREKTKGKGWYNMPAPEMTEERKNDLEVLQMRKALDPKRFYKKTDIRALPKYFQFGTVIESSADFYHSRIPKKQRKANMVQELLADAEFRKYNKRKYVEIQEAKMKGEGPYKRIKRVKRKKK